MKINLLDLIDFKKVNILLEGFNKSTGFVTAILDLDGNILSKSGWRQICTEFHRIHPETSKKCTISDTVLAGKLAEGEKFHFYKCLNGLVDVAVPIIINDEHIANLFSGQFFFEKPDFEFFKKQAKKFGFDEEKYIEALGKVPIVSEKKVKVAMDFLQNMTQLISEMTLQQLEQVELTEALRKSEDHWQFAIEGNGDGLWDWNVQTNEIFFSNQWKNMLGFHENEIENKFDEWDKRVHSKDKTKAYDNIQKYLDGTSNVYYSEYRMLCKDGSYKWILDRGKIVSRDSENKPLRFIGTHTDITERKNAADELKKQRNMFELVINSVPSRIFWKDLNSVYLGCNTPFAKAARKKKIENVIGKKDYDLVWGKEAEKYIANDKNVINTGIPRLGYEEDYILPDGKKVWWHSSKMPLKDSTGKIIGILCTSDDITDRKSAEKALKESEEKFRLAFLTSPDSININRLEDGMYIDINDSFTQITGYTRKETIGKTSSEINIWTNVEDRKRLVDGLKTSGKVENLETKFKLKNGQIIDGLMSASLISIGGVEHILSITKDISDQKQAELEIKKLNQELELRVKQRTAQLESANKELETFTYSVSHDLKAPLRGIDGYSKLLSDLYKSSLNEEAQIFIETIRSSTIQMNKLIDDLLDYSRLERSLLSIQTVKIKALISSILFIYKVDLEAGNFKINLNIADIELVADPKGLTIALRNLLENAIKFTRAKPEPLIQIKVEEKDLSWVISVNDNGIGFDIQYHQKIFEIFQRLQRVEDFPGTGIGLAMVNKAMQRMHGRVWADSTLGVGSTFYLEIPKNQ